MQPPRKEAAVPFGCHDAAAPQKPKPPERSLSPAVKAATNLEFVAQCELHYAWLIEQRGIVAEGRPLIQAELGGLNVEDRRICDVVDFPAELQALAIGPRHCPPFG